MLPKLVPRRFTVDEYYRMAETGILTQDDRVELLGGEIVEMTPIGPTHAGCVDQLNAMFQARLPPSACVRIQNPVRLDQHWEPQPDVAILRPRPAGYRDRHPGPTDVLLIVEVADASLLRDRKIKVPKYAAFGIAESWIVDLVARRVEVFRRPSASGYRTVRRAGLRATVSPMAFPKCRFAVAEIVG